MNIFKRIAVKFIEFTGKIHWKEKHKLSSSELADIRKLLTDNYYVILTRRNNHLSTYMISLANLILRGKLSYWSHALMNLEDKVSSDDDFLLIEAIGKGVTVSHFNKVFNCNGVVLLRPRNMPVKNWTRVLDKARKNVGKKYDNLFDLKNDKEMSCVELVRDALQADPAYSINFAEFEKMITESKNLTPQMFYDCPDFEVVYEIRNR